VCWCGGCCIGIFGIVSCFRFLWGVSDGVFGRAGLSDLGCRSFGAVFWGFYWSFGGSLGPCLLYIFDLFGGCLWS